MLKLCTHVREDVRTAAEGWCIALPWNVSPAPLVRDTDGNFWISNLLKGVKLCRRVRGQLRQAWLSHRCNTACCKGHLCKTLFFRAIFCGAMSNFSCGPSHFERKYRCMSLFHEWDVKMDFLLKAMCGRCYMDEGCIILFDKRKKTLHNNLLLKRQNKSLHHNIKMQFCIQTQINF